ncbi:centromere protein T, isoform CRA_a [Mus musculus]|nr:centromere protein T, isoform CRA_a [Mus musculus]
MADLSFSDGDPTVRTLLRRVLETADSRTPMRRRSTRINPRIVHCDARPSGEASTSTRSGPVLQTGEQSGKPGATPS